MSDQLLTFLKYIFLAVLYLFFLRVLRATWLELREPKPAPGPAGGPVSAAAGADTIVTGAPAAPPAAEPAAATGRWWRRRQGDERLVVVEPAERKGQEFALGNELTVGRASGCSVSLADDTFVSQLHARVFRQDGELMVEDLGSTNGTYLNKRKLTSAVPIRKGDRLQIGKTTLELRR